MERCKKLLEARFGVVRVRHACLGSLFRLGCARLRQWPSPLFRSLCSAENLREGLAHILREGLARWRIALTHGCWSPNMFATSGLLHTRDPAYVRYDDRSVVQLLPSNTRKV